MALPSDTLTLALVLILAVAALAYLVNRRLAQRRRLEDRVVELETLGRVGRALAEGQLDYEALYELIHQQVSSIIDTSTFQLGVFENGRYRIVIWVREGVRQATAVFDLEGKENLIRWVGEHKAPLLIRDYEVEWDELPARPSYPNDNPPHAAVFVPLVAGDECIGVLAAQSLARGAFTQDDVRRLSIVGNQAAVAIANARLYHQAQTRAAQLELVSRVARQVRAFVPLHDFFEQAVHLIQSSFGYYCVNIYSHDAAAGQVNLQASTLVEVAQDHSQPPAGKGLINWSVEHVETVLVNDVLSDPRYLRLSLLPATRSEIVVPLIVEKQVLGALDVQSDQPDAFGSEDRFALETLADQVALAIHESHLYYAERQQRSVAETLREVAQAITSSLELETVLPSILTDLRRVLAFDAAAVLLLEADGKVMVQATQGLPSVVATQGQRFDLRESARLQQLAESDQPIIFRGAEPEGHYDELLQLPPGRGCLGAPLIARGGLIGFLTADALPPHQYQPEDAAVIAAFAGQAAVAIDNARLYASQRDQAWVATALLRVAEATSQSTELDEVLDTVTRMTLTLVGVARCGILLWDDERSAFQGTKLAGSDAELIEEFARLALPIDAWMPLRSLKSRPHPVILGGGEALTALPDELFDFFGLDAWLLLIPLLAKGALIGVMLVSGETTEVETIRNRVNLISGIASQAALAIENAQLYTAQQEEAYVTIALLQVAEAVNSLTDLEEILSTVVRLAPLLAGVEQCVILRTPGARSTISAGPEYGITPEKLESLRRSLAEPAVIGLLNAFQVAREPVGAGVGFELSLPPGWGEVFDTGGVLAIPLHSRRGAVGLVLVSVPADGSLLGIRRQNILTGIAHQASTAIENDQLYAEAVERKRMERELEVAREIQSSFLPRIRPEEPGWSVDTFWQAARHVGGDFYDFFQVSTDDRQQWGVVIADVADKGVPAALYMALSRTLIRTIGTGRVDPASSLERVNNLLLKDSGSDLFVSVVYSVWDPQGNTLTFANAGHNPPLRIRADGTVEVLTENDMILGVLPDVSMHNHSLDLGPGDVVILYTDGVTDALGEDGREFGLDNLIDVASAHRKGTASGIVQGIRDAVADFVGAAPQFDDLTLVVIKREFEPAISDPRN